MAKDFSPLFSPLPNRLRGKTALVTGAGRGIGAAVAVRLAAEGCHTFLFSRTRAELQDVAKAIATRNGSAEIIVGDVSDGGQVTNAIEKIVGAHGRLDVLVNAAGVYGPIGPSWDVSAEDWARAFEINVLGTFYVCRAAVPHMIRAGRGKIITFSGGGATAPLPNFSAYAVTKAAVVRLTDTLAEELRPFNVQVNAIAPGAVDTKLQDEVLAAGERAGPLLARMKKLRESGEGGVPAELPAALAAFLASDDSRGLTGKLIAAPHDGWENWKATTIDRINAQAWFTIRRLDPFTIQCLTDIEQPSTKAAGDKG